MSIFEMLREEEDYGPVAVDLRCDFPGAEVLLVDGQQRLVAHDIQRLQLSVSPGVYTARVRGGEPLRDERIGVYPERPLSRQLSAPLIASAIPFEGAAENERHQDVLRN